MTEIQRSKMAGKENQYQRKHQTNPKVHHPHCRGCGHRFYTMSPHDQYCETCEETQAVLDSLIGDGDDPFEPFNPADDAERNWDDDHAYNVDLFELAHGNG